MRTVLLSILTAILTTLYAQADVVEGLVFDEFVCDIGTLSEDDDPVTVRFSFTNQSRSPIIITRIAVVCGCTNPDYSKEPIMPNESGEVLVTFYPKGQVGSVSRNIYVYTNLSKDKVSSVIKIEGVVTRTKDKFWAYSYSMGNLRLKQKSAEFKNLRIGQRRKVHIQVANSGIYNLELSAQNLPSYMSFHCEPKVIKPDSVADIVLTLDTNLLDTSTIIKRDVYISGVGFVAPSHREIKVTGNVVE